MSRLNIGMAALLLLLASQSSAADDPLVRAAAAGDMTTVRALLRQGHDVDARRWRRVDGAALGGARRRPRHRQRAASRRRARHRRERAWRHAGLCGRRTGNAAILRRLLDAGADVKTTDASGDTLLMAAVRAGNARRGGSAARARRAGQRRAIRSAVIPR